MSFIALFIMVAYTVTLVLFMWRRFDHLNDEKLKERFEEAYADFNIGKAS